MKRTYEPKTFRADTLALIDQANTIIDECEELWISGKVEFVLPIRSQWSVL